LISRVSGEHPVVNRCESMHLLCCFNCCAVASYPRRVQLMRDLDAGCEADYDLTYAQLLPTMRALLNARPDDAAAEKVRVGWRGGEGTKYQG